MQDIETGRPVVRSPAKADGPATAAVVVSASAPSAAGGGTASARGGGADPARSIALTVSVPAVGSPAALIEMQSVGSASQPPPPIPLPGAIASPADASPAAADDSSLLTASGVGLPIGVETQTRPATPPVGRSSSGVVGAGGGGVQFASRASLSSNSGGGASSLSLSDEKESSATDARPLLAALPPSASDQ